MGEIAPKRAQTDDKRRHEDEYECEEEKRKANPGETAKQSKQQEKRDKNEYRNQRNHARERADTDGFRLVSVFELRGDCAAENR